MQWVARWAAEAVRKDEATEEQRILRKALIRWSSLREWDVFYTQTFRKPSRTIGATRDRWSRCLAELCYFWGATAALWAIEPHATTRAYHVHSLLAVNWSMQRRLSAETSQTSSQTSTSCTRSSSTSSTGWSDTSRRRTKPGLSTESPFRALKEWAFKRYGIARPLPVTTDQETMTVAYVVKYLMKRVKRSSLPAWQIEKTAPPETDWGLWTAPTSEGRAFRMDRS